MFDAKLLVIYAERLEECKLDNDFATTKIGSC